KKHSRARTLHRNIMLAQAVTEGPMSAAVIVRDWRRTVATQLFPGLHGHQAHPLADLSLALARAGRCQAGQLADHVPTAATPASARRRCERPLGNRRLHARRAQIQLAFGLLEHWGGQTILL